MKRKFKKRKWVTALLAIMLIITGMYAPGNKESAYAEDGSASETPSIRIEVDKNEIVKGEAITVDIYLTVSKQIILFNIGFYYDASIFEYPDLKAAVVGDSVRDLYGLPEPDATGEQWCLLQALRTDLRYYSNEKIIKMTLLPKVTTDCSEIGFLYPSVAGGPTFSADSDEEIIYTIGSSENTESTSDQETGNKVEHLYKDDKYKNEVKTDSINIYANGGTVTKNDIKTNYKSYSLYTNILASYKYWTDTKGKYQTGTGKVIVGIAKTNDKSKLTFAKNGSIADADAAKIASASIKNGLITVTAKSQAGTVYLWVMDTGDAGTYTYCPVTVKMAPTALYTYQTSNVQFGTTAKYTKASIDVSDTTDVYVYPTYKENKVEKKTTDATYTAAVEDKA